MANTKISALTAATTPLAGTEVLPIVQSGATVKVANNDLRPKQIQSNATSGVLQIAGPAAASTRVMTTPDANFTVARTDAANSFTADQTLATGNLVQGTAAKGVNFIANTPAAGMTSRLLNWYEEGTWTPTITSGVTTPGYATQNGAYTRIGRLVTFMARLELNAGTGAANILQIGGLPFTVNNTFRGGASLFAYLAGSVINSTSTNAPTLTVVAGSTDIQFYKTDGTAFNGTNLSTASSLSLDFCGMYFV